MFKEFVQEDVNSQKPKVDLYELTYHNTVSVCDYWKGPSETTNVIPSFKIPDWGLDNFATDPAFTCTYNYALSKNLRLRVTIRSVEQVTETRTPMLLIEISAVGHPEELDADSWFEQAHGAILACFEGMTSKEVQRKYWKLVTTT